MNISVSSEISHLQYLGTSADSDKYSLTITVFGTRRICELAQKLLFSNMEKNVRVEGEWVDG